MLPKDYVFLRLTAPLESTQILLLKDASQVAAIPPISETLIQLHALLYVQSLHSSIPKMDIV